VVRGKPGAHLDDPPDGFDALTDHNLITFKSLHESLNRWSIEELISHLVSYRKLISPRGKLLPIERFGLFAVITRFPKGLVDDLELESRADGVYDVEYGLTPLRFVVLSEVSLEPRNAVWQLFSGIPERIREGERRYQWHDPETSRIVRTLYQTYQAEGIEMAYTMEDLEREAALQTLPFLTPEERLKGLPPEERVKGMSYEEILRAFRKTNPRVATLLEKELEK